MLLVTRARSSPIKPNGWCIPHHVPKVTEAARRKRSSRPKTNPMCNFPPAPCRSRCRSLGLATLHVPAAVSPTSLSPSSAEFHFFQGVYCYEPSCISRGSPRRLCEEGLRRWPAPRQAWINIHRHIAPDGRKSARPRWSPAWPRIGPRSAIFGYSRSPGQSPMPPTRPTLSMFLTTQFPRLTAL